MWKCSCEGFAKDKDCKHRIAVALHKQGMEEAKGREAEQLRIRVEFDPIDEAMAEADAIDSDLRQNYGIEY